MLGRNRESIEAKLKEGNNRKDEVNKEFEERERLKQAERGKVIEDAALKALMMHNEKYRE